MPISTLPTTPLDWIGLKHGTDKASSAHDYLRLYEELLGPVRESAERIIEFGVLRCESIRTWLDFFPKAHVVGVDLGNPTGFQNDRFEFVQTDAADPATYSHPSLQGPFDAVIDDCSHTIDVTMHVIGLLSRIKPGGWLFIEDVNMYTRDYAKPSNLMLVNEAVRVMHSNWKHNARKNWSTTERASPFKNALGRIVMQPGIVAIQRS